MNGERVDGLARILAHGASRRRWLQALLAGAAGGLPVALSTGAADAACRGLGRPCTGHQECCAGLVCGEGGRCEAAPTACQPLGASCASYLFECCGFSEPANACCGGACIDIRTDNDNCGLCGNQCNQPAGFTCQAGRCCSAGGCVPAICAPL